MPKKFLIIASPYAVYRSNQLESSQEIDMNSSCSGLVSNTIANTILETSRMSASELREVEIFFYLFMKDLPNSSELTEEQERLNRLKKCVDNDDLNLEIKNELTQDAQLVEKAILASLFLNKDQVFERFSFIHDLMYKISIERFNYGLPNHWKISLPDQTEKVFSLGLEADTAVTEGLFTFGTRSYYHIQKYELMNRVKHLLCGGLFNDVEPTTMDEIEELYNRLLNYKGAVMGKTASNQFPNDEVVFLWNRSMIGESLEEAGYLNPALERVNDSILDFTVTHHDMVMNGDESIPIVSDDIGTNDQLKKALDHNGMFDQRLMLRTTGSITDRRDVDLQAVRERLVDIFPLTKRSQRGIGIKINGNDYLFLREFDPREILRNLDAKEELILDDDEKELVELRSSELSLDEPNSEIQVRENLRIEKETLGLEDERLKEREENLRWEEERKRLNKEGKRLREERRLGKEDKRSEEEKKRFGEEGDRLDREREKLYGRTKNLRKEIGLVRREKVNRRKRKKVNLEKENLTKERESGRKRRTNLFLRKKQVGLPVDKELLTKKEVLEILSQVEPEILETELTTHNLEEEYFNMLSSEDKLDFILSSDRMDLDLDNDGSFMLSYI